MSVIFYILGALAALGGLGCSIFIIVEAFRDEIWKGVLCLVCGLYWLYWVFADFDHEWKWPIVLGAIGGNGIAFGLFNLAAGHGL